MSVNKVILLGHVGKDPEMNLSDAKNPVARFSLATNMRTSGGQELTEWHRIVMTGRNAELAERYIRCGSRLYLEGRLRTRSYQDKFNINRYITEIYVDTFELLGRTTTT